MRAGYVVDARRIETAEQLREALAQPDSLDLVLADYTLPSFGARDALAIIQQSGVEIPFIIVSGTIDEVSAVNAMRAGAHDYVLKGHLDRLLPADRARACGRGAAPRAHSHRGGAAASPATIFRHVQPGGCGYGAHDDDGALSACESAARRDAWHFGRASRCRCCSRTFCCRRRGSLSRRSCWSLVSGRQAGHRVERELLRYDGTTFPAQLTVSLLRHDDSTAPSLLWVVEDISARKAAERETSELMSRLINSERLAAAGRMANTLAHEINNPLEALTNIVYLLQTHELPPPARELAAVAARELERVGHITRSTLSFYRKAPGRTLDLYAMLDEVVQLFGLRAMQTIASTFARDSMRSCARRTMIRRCAR